MLALGGCGLTAPRASPGYAELGSPDLRGADRVLSLSLGPALLRNAARHADEDPVTRVLLESLEGVRIFIYEWEEDTQAAASRIDAVSRRLQNRGWKPVVLARGELETAHMLLRTAGQRILGMTVLVVDGDSEAVIVNLMGDIAPARFADMMRALDAGTPALRPAGPGGG